MSTIADDDEAVERHRLAGSHCDQFYLGTSVSGSGQQVCQPHAFVVHGCIIDVVLDCKECCQCTMKEEFNSTDATMMKWL